MFKIPLDKSKNKQLTVWLSREVHADFEDWLKINSVGANMAERLRQMIYQINAGNLVLKYKAIQDIHARRLEQTLEEQKREKEEREKPKETPKQHQSASVIRQKQKEQGWYYSIQLQGLVKRKHAPTHDEHGVLLPHLRALKETQT